MPAIIGPPTTRAHAPLLLDRGLRNVFFQQHELSDTDYELIYTVEESDKQTERDVVMAPLGTLFPKNEGDAPIFDSGQQFYSKLYTHLTWALGWEVTEEAIEDELYGWLKAMAKELAVTAGYTRAVQALAHLNNGSAAAYTVDSTDYTLLNTAHPLITGGTWSNTFASNTDLGLESLETALQRWNGEMVDPRGRKVTYPPKYLCVGTSDEGIARRLLQTMNRPGGNDNDVNWIRTNRNLELIVFKHMTNDTRWYLIADPMYTTARYNNRRPTRMRRGSEDRSGNLLEIVSYRVSHGVASAQGHFGSL
jgi:hypothetical protein